jgi:hypothetical protein
MGLWGGGINEGGFGLVRAVSLGFENECESALVSLMLLLLLRVLRCLCCFELLLGE